jgi:hypothetical protein
MTSVFGYAAAAIIAVALLEFVARWLIAYRRRYYAFVPHSSREFRLSRETLPQLPEFVAIRINADGERGEAPPRDTREQTFRILVAGGSAAECLYIDQASTWPAVVRARLEEPAALRKFGVKHVHIGSIAKSGIHTDSVRLILERALPRYRRLDAIVIVVGAGEAIRWIAADAPVDGIPESPFADAFAEHPELRFALFPPRQSGLAECVRRLKARRFPERRDDVGRWLAAARRQRNNPAEVRESIRSPERMLANYERNVGSILRLAKEHAEYVLFVRQPWFTAASRTDAARALFWNFGVERPGENGSTTFYSEAVTEDLLERLDQLSVEVSAREGVECLDLSPYLVPSLDTYYDQFHFTVLGNRIIGDAVAARLNEMIEQR